MKFNQNNGRAEFVNDENGNPLQIVVPADTSIEDFELSNDDKKNLKAGGATDAHLSQALASNEIFAEVIASLGGLRESVDGKTVTTTLQLRELSSAKVVTSSFTTEKGTRIPEPGDTVSFRRYPAPGLYYNKLGKGKASNLVCCLVPGDTPVKQANVGETSEAALRKQVLLAERDAVRQRATAAAKATTEAYRIERHPKGCLSSPFCIPYLISNRISELIYSTVIYNGVF